MHKHLTMKNLMSGYGMRLAHPNGMARACHIPNSTRGNLRENTARLESKRSLLRFGIDSWNQTYQRLNLFAAKGWEPFSTAPSGVSITKTLRNSPFCSLATPSLQLVIERYEAKK